VLPLPVPLLKSAQAPTAVFCSVVVFGKERPGTDACIELGGGITQERIQTNSRIARACAKAQKGVLSFGCVATGIASVRRRSDRFRVWSDGREAQE
jgi:hypothetical protein